MALAENTDLTSLSYSALMPAYLEEAILFLLWCKLECLRPLSSDPVERVMLFKCLVCGFFSVYYLLLAPYKSFPHRSSSFCTLVSILKKGLLEKGSKREKQSAILAQWHGLDLRPRICAHCVAPWSTSAHMLHFAYLTLLL